MKPLYRLKPISSLPFAANFLDRMNGFLAKLAQPKINFNDSPKEGFIANNDLRLFFKAGVIDTDGNLGVIVNIPETSNYLARVNWNLYKIEVMQGDQKITEAFLSTTLEHKNSSRSVIAKFPDKTLLDKNIKDYHLVLRNKDNGQSRRRNMPPKGARKPLHQPSPSAVS